MLVDDTGLGFRNQLNNKFDSVDGEISTLSQQIQDLNPTQCASMYTQTITDMVSGTSVDLSIPITQGAVINILQVTLVGQELVTQISTVGGSNQDFTIIKKSDTEITLKKNSEGTNSVIIYSTY